MGTTIDKLNKLSETKAAIKAAIIAKGQSIEDSDTFASYADKITALSDIKTGTIKASNSSTLSVPAIAGAKNVILTLYSTSSTVVSSQPVIVEKFDDNTRKLVYSDSVGNIIIKSGSQTGITIDDAGTIKLSSVYFADATYFYVAW